MNPLKEFLSNKFNYFSRRCMEKVAVELSARQSDHSFEELRQEIDRADKIAELAGRFGQREVTPDVVKSARQLCWARAAQQQLSIMAQPNFFEKMQLVAEARGSMKEYCRMEYKSGIPVISEIDNLLTQYYEPIDRLDILFTHSGLVGNSYDEVKIMDTITRLAIWRENFPSDGEFDEFMSNANKWLGLTIADKIEKLKSYTSPCPK